MMKDREERAARDLAALNELADYGNCRAKELGLDQPSEAEARAFVERVIAEDREKRRR